MSNRERGRERECREGAEGRHEESRKVMMRERERERKREKERERERGREREKEREKDRAGSKGNR
jgi:hypothetical protein